MAQTKTYTPIAKWFHWIIVALVALELLLAALMPDIRRGMTPDTLINLHMSFGVAIILVMLARLLWRLVHRAPPLPADSPRLETLAAQAMHFALYLLLFLIPFAGWAWASALGWEVTLFGLVALPAILSKGSPLLHLAAQVHALLAGGIIVLIALHTLAALYHWYVKKDDVLERMLPEHPLMRRTLEYFERWR